MIPNILTFKETCAVLRIGRTQLTEILKSDPTFPAIQARDRCKWRVNGDHLERWINQKILEKQKGKQNENNN